jgi:hypothetical protein
MNPTENLQRLHAHEEEIRAKNLTVIEQNPASRDHWAIVSEAMNVMYAFAHDHEHQSDDELTLQFLGIRLFNAAAASIKLALSGYYQKAFDHVRDVLETSFLIDYLATFPEKIAVWKAADKKLIAPASRKLGIEVEEMATATRVVHDETNPINSTAVPLKPHWATSTHIMTFRAITLG